MKRIAVLFAAIFVAPQLSWASEAYDFMSAIINALHRSQAAHTRIQSKGKTLLEQMTNIQVFAAEFHRANGLVAPFTKSRNEFIKESALSFGHIFSSFITNTDQGLSLLEQAQNNPEAFYNQEGSFNRKFSTIVAANEQLWRDLMHVTALSTHALVDLKRTPDGKLRYLLITSSERERLRESLKISFGVKVTRGTNTNLSPPEVSGALLWKALNEGFKSSDSK